MSKQLQLKFKKMLKKAEFVHADLEYHEELSDDSKKLFGEAINKLFLALDPEDQDRLREIAHQKTLRQQEQAIKEKLQHQDQKEKEIEDI